MNKKEYSTKQEKTIADYLDWHRVTGSGAVPLLTGDIESSEWLGECKTHVKDGQLIRFDSEVLDKIVSEASAKFKQPAYFVDDGSQRVSRTWVMFLYRDLSSNFVIEEYPYKVGKTTTYYHNELAEITPNHTFYRLQFGKYKVLVTRLDTFQEIL